MKRTILAIAISVATFGSATVFAQKACDSRMQEKCAAGECASAQTSADNKMYKPQKFTDYAFEGILLTVDQQSKMDKLNADLKAKREACKNDTAACAGKDCKGCKGRTDRGKNRLQARKDYVSSVKEILTPEQYVTFLENIVFMPEQGRGMGPRHKGCRKDMVNCGMHKADKSRITAKGDHRVKKAEKATGF